jgi:hypothetical protein
MGEVALGRRVGIQCMVDSNCELPGVICEYCSDANNNNKIEQTYYYCVEHKGNHFQTQHNL